jgi:protein-S-isoprenylcysteine O-methyltransferase Ste14
MTAPDFRIYYAHAGFWLAFAAGDLAARFARRPGRDVPPPTASVNTGNSLRAPRANLLLAVHMLAFAVLYGAIGQAVLGVHRHTPTRRAIAAGAVVILLGAILAAWARISFASWRFRAQLDAGHRLATGGPFRIVRHPIYAALDLLAIGTALWIGGAAAWVSVLLMAVAGDLRARAEEPLLQRAFGDEYDAYQRTTRRFIPGIY